MPIDSIHDLTFTEIPNFNCCIMWSWGKIISIWMEGNRVYDISMSIIMLKQSLWTTIEYFYFFVWCTGRQAGAIWMEPNSRDHAGMIHECMNNLFSCQIPKFDSAIVTSWSNHSWIQWELRASNPILMASQCLFELKFLHVPHLNKFVVRCRDEKGTVCVEINTLHWGSVTFHDCTLSACVIFPHSYWRIPWSWSNIVTLRIDWNITYWTRMSNEFVRSCIWSQSPCLYKAIIRARDYLFETWMEQCHGNSIFMAL